MPALDLARLGERLRGFGLNDLGVVSAARFDAAAPPGSRIGDVQPGARSVVVVASGGRAHWDAFLAYVARSPVERLASREHPLDDYCAEAFATLAPELADCTLVFPTLRSPIPLDFMRLADLAGIGRPSELGILVSPTFGPWFGLRAAIFTRDALAEREPAVRMCDGCEAPCRAVCPPGAVGERFSLPLCMGERAAPGSSCTERCAAREACVVGREHAYDPLERVYHYDRRRGRALLCARFGVTDAIAC